MTLRWPTDLFSGVTDRVSAVVQSGLGSIAALFQSTNKDSQPADTTPEQNAEDIDAPRTPLGRASAWARTAEGPSLDGVTVLQQMFGIGFIITLSLIHI